MCGCGKLKENHSDMAIIESDEPIKKWDANICTEEVELTDAYGDIKFNNQDNLSKFIRVGHKTPVDVLLRVLFDCWQLKSPQLLISVTGGKLLI